MPPPPPAWSFFHDTPSPTPSDIPRTATASDRPKQQPNMAPSTSQERIEQPKKPRHRHSAFQLAALNELYEKNEHPSLEERTSLAERLGMETKTVNSWFQNKRASSKKRHRGPPTTSNMAGTGNNSGNNKSSGAVELPPISTLIASVSAPLVPGSMSYGSPEYEEFSDDEQMSRFHSQHGSLFYGGGAPAKSMLLDQPESGLARKGRSRPTAAQTEELRKVYEVNAHPTKEEREELGAKIGMRYQSVTNWFQNQRSIAKKRREDDDALPPALTVSVAHAQLPAPSKARTFSPFPPAAGTAHPSLSVPPATSHPSLSIPIPSQAPSAPVSRARRSPGSVSAVHGFHHSHSQSSSVPSSPRVSPYRTPSDRSHTTATERSHARPRRTRPEPHQLEALKKLFRRTATPSIEERGALALEIGMDVGKVTNWFRNLRQTARKRQSAASAMRLDGEEDELDEEDGAEGDGEHDMDIDIDADNVSLATYTVSRSVSRSATPMHSGAPSPLIHEGHSAPLPYTLDESDIPLYLTEHREHIYGPVAPPKHSRLSNREAFHPSRVAYAPTHVHAPPKMRSHHSSGSGSDPDAYADADSHMGSEEEMQEAVTPSPEASPPPPVSYVALEKAALSSKVPKLETGVKVEDALLLLSFHHQIA